ncbi:MAG: NUDIX domain-containing protein [Anaerolineales bacterium]|nr:NUDIX domain-containing protein [Anaerolineales bacterium]MCS7247691.1 NUDIX domain-containing protein [Anaerolineales bacterium]MDW8161501.1 NUDIX domain-containing protein [Anaerolineales bacterium]MDW8445822.1 NUDIX domain-containing protein [Anaerolineales bacterium]
MSVGRFIGGVGALLWRSSDNRYLLLQRSPDKDYAQGVWEPVTGRLEQGEGFEDALQRELREELGLDARPLYILGTTHFYRGEAVAENELIGVVYLCHFSGKGQPRLSAEHTQARWLTATEAFALLTDPTPPTLWTRRVIERAEAVRQKIPFQSLLALSQEGYELG